MRNKHLVASIFTVLVVTSLLVPFLGAAGTAAEGEGFTPSVTKEHVGDIAYITINPQSELHDPVVKIGDVEEDGYAIKFRIQGDYYPYEKLVFAYDTTAAGHPEKKTVRLIKPSGDLSKNNIEVIRETEIKNPPIDPASYSMKLYDGNNELVDIGQLDLLDAGEPSSVITRVQSDASKEEVIGSKQASSDKVAVGDLAVFKFDAHGTSAYIPSGVDATELRKGGPIHDKYGVYITLRDLTSAQNQPPSSYSLEHVKVYRDNTKDKLYFAVDSRYYDSMDVGDKVQLTLHVEERNPYIPAGQYTNAFDLVERKGWFDAGSDNTYTVQPNGSLTVSGGTTVAPGSEITVVIRSDENPPVYRKKVVKVSENSRFNATFKFDDVPEGTAPIKFKGMSGSAEVKITNSASTSDGSTPATTTDSTDSTPVEQPTDKGTETTKTSSSPTKTETKTTQTTSESTKTDDGPKKIGDKPPAPGSPGFTTVTVLFTAAVLFGLVAFSRKRE